MGWQDRDYASPGKGHGPVYRTPSFGGAGVFRGRSVVTTLIIINVAIYVLSTMSPFFEGLFYGGGAMQAQAVLDGQLWRLITAQYLHGGTGHLFMNMLCLYFLGRPLEQMWSKKKFLAVYTVCGLFGNIFYTFLGAQNIIHPLTPQVGASGSIYGLMGIVAVLFPTATVYVYFLFPVRIRTAAFIFGGIAFLSILSKGQNFGGEACHLAGLVFGVWWAMKGDAWWTRSEWRLPNLSRPTKRPKTTGFKARVQQRKTDAESVDRILKKVYDKGIQSLSDHEKTTLKEATDRQLEDDRRTGRTDRR